jgi:hypothetical protein
LRERRAVQKKRVVSDRLLLQSFSGIIAFQPLDNILLRYIANPILNLYLIFLRNIVRW